MLPNENKIQSISSFNGKKKVLLYLRKSSSKMVIDIISPKNDLPINFINNLNEKNVFRNSAEAKHGRKETNNLVNFLNSKMEKLKNFSFSCEKKL